MKTRETIAEKKLWVLPIFISLTFLSSCIKDHYKNFGFDSDFDRNSSGYTMMSICSQASSVRLAGDVFIDSGELKVEFTDSDGFIVYGRSFFAPGYYSINETFKASGGIWKLRYTSIDGAGSIDLHATYR